MPKLYGFDGKQRLSYPTNRIAGGYLLIKKFGIGSWFVSGNNFQELRRAVPENYYLLNLWGDYHFSDPVIGMVSHIDVARGICYERCRLVKPGICAIGIFKPRAITRNSSYYA